MMSTENMTDTSWKWTHQNDLAKGMRVRATSLHGDSQAIFTIQEIGFRGQVVGPDWVLDPDEYAWDVDTATILPPMCLDLDAGGAELHLCSAVERGVVSLDATSDASFEEAGQYVTLDLDLGRVQVLARWLTAWVEMVQESLAGMVQEATPEDRTRALDAAAKIARETGLYESTITDGLERGLGA